MNFTDDFLEQLQQYIDAPWFQKLANSLNIYQGDGISNKERIDKVEVYISETLLGRFRGESAIKKFFKCLEVYSKQSDFVRNEHGLVDNTTLLPINNELKYRGLRSVKEVLAQDGTTYILKQSEALKGPTCALKSNMESLYNPNVAQAVFKFLEEPCAEHYPACEGIPYFYILSKNFLQENQECHPISDETFFQGKLNYDVNNNVSHEQILHLITDGVKENYGEQLTEEKLVSLCNKLKLQYATQEVIKKLIKSIDENLGNTSLIVTQDAKGCITDLNISPAYDLDLTFSLGEEVLSIDYSNNNFYRTAYNGGTDLASLLLEFKDIPGFQEKMKDINTKFKENYIDQIMQDAYNTSNAKKLQDSALKAKYGSFLMKQVVCFKDAYQKTFEQERDDREI